MTKEELKKMSFREVLRLLRKKILANVIIIEKDYIEYNGIKIDLTKDPKDWSEETLQKLIDIVK